MSDISYTEGKVKEETFDNVSIHSMTSSISIKEVSIAKKGYDSRNGQFSLKAFGDFELKDENNNISNELWLFFFHNILKI